MKRRAFIQASLGFGLSGQWSAHALEKLQWKTTTFNGLGTALSIRAAHADVNTLNGALAAARAVVAHVEDQMSLFRPKSAINLLNRDGELLHPHPDLLRVLQESQLVAMKSRGAFDVTIQPLWRAYSSAQKLGRLPTALEIQQARQHVGWRHLHVDAQRISFSKAAMEITLNGIAQGYASDRVRETLRHHGIEHALINTGEWSSLGHADGGRDWILGVADPHQAERLITRLQMKGMCIATSADDQCTFSGDRIHHHILNPETGYSPADISSVTVVAASCMQADALTKVLFMGGYERAIDIAHEWKVDALVVHKDGQFKATPNLSQTS